MAAEALILEDAYQKGYADAMADMRKKKEQRQQREQAKKARRWYFIKQKACGLAMLAITVLAVWATEGDITIAFITGRLTREPELRYGGQDNSTAITRFTLAVDDGKDTDFINIKCFGRTAEWAQKWLSKGSRAEVTGKIKTGSYESQRTGSKVYYTEVVANSVGFGESKAEAEARGQQLPESDGFMNIPEGADEELPFN